MPVLRWAGGLFSVLFLGTAAASPARAIESMKIAEFTAGLDRLVAIWEDVHNLHDYLRELQTVVLVVGDSLVIFEPDSDGIAYEYQSTVAAPFPMASGIRAAFPLQATQGRPACVVGEDIFESEENLILLLHEFVHCSQGNTVEYEIKATLAIATEATERGDFMWELEHPFPYADPEFVLSYSAMNASLLAGDAERALAERAKLRAHLSAIDYEYMVWEEWKEGLARYLENRIQERRGLPVNTFGDEPPYDRIAFYHGGAHWIAYLVRMDPALDADPKALFEAMRLFGGPLPPPPRRQ
ncbi:MAG: hypothetical protein OEN01_13505 [Candidatus Krumholzibacteria bacterium]|nr:hypothetical protein [Candidatus Krumholzibacteria bacterium]